MPLPLRTHLGYGIGDFGQNLLFQTVAFFLLSFYTDVMLLSATFAANLFLFSRLWDGINDPLMGWMAQQTRSRWGTYRPYLLWMALPVGLLLLALFSVPDFSDVGKQWYAALTYLGFTMAFTALNIPFGALTAVLTDDYQERGKLTGFRMTFGMLGGILAAFGFSPLVQQAETVEMGYLIAAACFALVLVICMGISFGTIREQVRVQTSLSISVTHLKKGLGNNRPFWLLCAIFGSCFAAYAVFASSLSYFARYLLDDASLTSILLLLIMGSTAASVPFWTWLSRKAGKKTAFLWGMLGYAIALSGLFFLDPTHRPGLYGLMVLYGLGNGAAVFGSWAMIADTIEYGEWKSGLRMEGVWYGIYGFFLKLGLGIGLWLAGQVLNGSGYVPNVAQSAESLLGIRLQVSLIPLAWIGLAWLLMWAYPIGAKVHQQIRDEIAPSST